MTVLKKILICSTRQKRNTFCLTETMPLSKPRGRLVKAGANRNPWIHCDYFGFGFL